VVSKQGVKVLHVIERGRQEGRSLYRVEGGWVEKIAGDEVRRNAQLVCVSREDVGVIRFETSVSPRVLLITS
jgi:hypothetical protein